MLVYVAAAFWRCDVVTSLPVTECIIRALLLRHNLSTTHHRICVYLYLYMWYVNLPLSKKKWCLLGVCWLCSFSYLNRNSNRVIVMTIFIYFKVSSGLAIIHAVNSWWENPKDWIEKYKETDKTFCPFDVLPMSQWGVEIGVGCWVTFLTDTCRADQWIAKLKFPIRGRRERINSGSL